MLRQRLARLRRLVVPGSPDGGRTVPDGGVASPDGDGDAAAPDGTTDERAERPRAEGSTHAIELDAREVVDLLPMPAFLVAADHTLVAYNDEICRQLDLGSGHDEFLGGDCRETIAAATYTDGRRHRTLVDKILESDGPPEEEWDIDRVDGDYGFSEKTIYGDSSTAVTNAGQEKEIAFVAIPFYDDAAEIEYVLELIEDNTESVRRREAVDDLVGEVTATLAAVGEGDLSARADDVESDYLEDDLQRLTGDVNGMARRFEGLVESVGAHADDIATVMANTADAVGEIDRTTSAQRESLESVSDELSSFSATMEEVAASSDQVAGAAEQARTAAGRGVDAGQDARDAVEAVSETGDDLVETVSALDDRMAEITEVVDVIADVAEQTNMLALNANIEAARAGNHSGADAGVGDGFAVVAEEVKSLANETSDHAADIRERIDAIQQQTADTVDSADESQQRIADAHECIRETLDALEEIDETVKEAASGIREVAEANDDQASSVEEMSATVNDTLSDIDGVLDAVEEITDQTSRGEGAVGELSDRVDDLASDR